MACDLVFSRLTLYALMFRRLVTGSPRGQHFEKIEYIYDAVAIDVFRAAARSPSGEHSEQIEYVNNTVGRLGAVGGALALIGNAVAVQIQ